MNYIFKNINQIKKYNNDHGNVEFKNITISKREEDAFVLTFECYGKEEQPIICGSNFARLFTTKDLAKALKDISYDNITNCG